MKKQLYTSILLFVVFHGGYAQKQWANYWPLRQGLALDFSNGQPQLTQACALNSFEACGAISDDQGQLQLYTNGGGRNTQFSPKGTIWNKNHDILYDMGHTEGGGYSARQGAVVIPAPGKPRNYYVLTMEEGEFDAGGSVPGQPLGRGFSAFLVNMDANGGLGAVEQYSPMLYTPAYEGLCAIQHPNCRDYWVIITDAETDDLLVFPITPQGIGTPQRFNFSTPLNPVSVGGVEIRATPDAQHVIAGSYLFRFNPLTGELSQALRITVDIVFWEFSPNSRYVYWQNGSSINRMDVKAADPNATTQVIGDIGVLGSGGRGAMQLGPDGSIWFRARASDSTTDFLHAIRQPDAENAFVETQVLTLPIDDFPLVPDFPAQWFSSTPNAVPQIQLGADLAFCSDTALMIPSGITGFPVVWNTGDTLATLPVNTPGTYIATVLGCTTTSDTIAVQQSNCACPIKIPNAFTPNGDQHNDTFGPASAPENYTLSIWNRWGQLVFQYKGSGPSRWDGMSDGKPAPTDVYVYQISWEACEKSATGEVTLLR